MATLYIIGTPIGNLEDITYRAIRIFSEVDTILCEDTRVTKKLLNEYEIDTPLLSYHAHSSLVKVDKICALLEEEKDLALVSDAGTPTISDPGVLLVSQVRDRFGDQVTIVAVPGPSALVSAISIAGISSAQFVFLGFLPHKKGRETLFEEIRVLKRTVVFYESPHRIMKTLFRLKEILDPDRKVVVAREMTKIHEELISGTAEEVYAYYDEHSDKVRGEYVVLIGAGKK